MFVIDLVGYYNNSLVTRVLYFKYSVQRRVSVSNNDFFITVHLSGSCRSVAYWHSADRQCLMRECTYKIDHMVIYYSWSRYESKNYWCTTIRYGMQERNHCEMDQHQMSKNKNYSDSTWNRTYLYYPPTRTYPWNSNYCGHTLWTYRIPPSTRYRPVPACPHEACIVQSLGSVGAWSPGQSSSLQMAGLVQRAVHSMSVQRRVNFQNFVVSKCCRILVWE